MGPPDLPRRAVVLLRDYPLGGITLQRYETRPRRAYLSHWDWTTHGPVHGWQFALLAWLTTMSNVALFLMPARPHFKTEEVISLPLKLERQKGAAEAGVDIATVAIATAARVMVDISLTDISILLFDGALLSR